jgi:RNA polymerase sigma-70 factor (ECF subfamily)
MESEPTADTRPRAAPAGDTSDLELAGLCLAGDRRAQRLLLERLRRSVHATLYRILGSNRHMDDLLQDALLEVFRSLRTFRGEARLATWSDQIATRVAYAHLARRRAPEVPLEIVPQVAADDPASERRIYYREAARRLYAALDRVEPNQRIAFTLHAIDGRPLREVAAAMRTSVLAVKSRIWRARRQLERQARRDPILAGLMAVRPEGNG